jgi:hypothetical protein
MSESAQEVQFDTAKAEAFAKMATNHRVRSGRSAFQRLVAIEGCPYDFPCDATKQRLHRSGPYQYGRAELQEF